MRKIYHSKMKNLTPIPLRLEFEIVRMLIRFSMKLFEF
uniref:Uncharacterized protein n=1 Tax=Romanomermis culicivorax TaxID=13658 RepID=A0A915KZS5_ROMCU